MSDVENEIRSILDNNEQFNKDLEMFFEKYSCAYESLSLDTIRKIKKSSFTSMANMLTRKYIDTKDDLSLTRSWLDQRDIVYEYILEQFELHYCLESM